MVLKRNPGARVASASMLAVSGVLLVSCGGGQPAPPPSAAGPPAGGEQPPPPAAAGNERIRADDLDRVVRMAQPVAGDARLVSAEPERVTGEATWRTVFVTGKPELRVVDVDAASGQVAPAQPAHGKNDAGRKLRTADSATRGWQEFAAMATRESGTGAVLAKVSLDTQHSDPAAPVWEITTLAGEQKLEHEYDAKSGQQISRDVDQRDGDDFD